MKYNFDELVDRHNTHAIKWEKYDENSNLKDCIPLWIADMDFNVCDEIKDAIIKRANHQVYGYTSPSDEFYDAIITWQKNKNNLNITKDSIILSTGVVYSYYQIINTLLKDDEKIIITTPAYPPFYNVPSGMKREVVECPLKQDGINYKFDFELFEKLIKEDNKIKLFNLCQPYNPLGFEYTLDELNKLCDICHKYGVYVLSDEIHSDLMLYGNKHISALNVNDAYKDMLITTFSPTKTFNIAGIKVSYAIVPDQKLCTTIKDSFHTSGCSDVNIFGLEALIAGYKYGTEWLEDLLKYIGDNFNFVDDYLKNNLPKVKFKVPTCTYLGWLDLSDYNLPENFQELLMKEAKVEFNPGSSFKWDYKYLRINVACPRAQLKEGLNRLKSWLDKLA